MSWTIGLFLAETAWIVGIATWVLLEKRPPVATLAWIFGLALMPLVGALFYFLWGPRRFDRKKREIREARGAIHAATQTKSSLFRREMANVAPLLALATKLGGLPTTTTTSTRIISQGDDYFAALAGAIAAATHHVHLEYYIFKHDSVGQRLVALLMERARSGVEVRLLADALGSRLPHGVIREMTDAGIRFAWFNPTAIARLGRRMINFRTHRKIAVIDGTVGFTGGTNIWAEHSRAVMADQARCDTDIELHGEAVQGLQHVFFQNWLFAADESIADKDFERYFPTCDVGDEFIQIIPSGPDVRDHAIYSFLLAAIGLARRRIWLTTPYFVPDETLLSALCIAAERGVDVEVIVPARSDWPLVDAAGASSHDELIRAGVKIYLFGPPLIHAKTAVIDDDLGIVGTANLDDRSMKLNFEVVAACCGGATVLRLAELFATNRARAALKRTFEADAPFSRRLLQAGARLLSPQL